jgi:hypothetical protein
MLYHHEEPISALGTDIGSCGDTACDTDFAMYHSLCTTNVYITVHTRVS